MAHIGKKIRIASNPHKKGNHNNMPAAKNPAKSNGKKKKNPAHRNPPAGAARNPGSAAKNPHKRPRKRGNPETFAAVFGSPKTIIVGAAAGLGSAVLTRQAPQWILGSNNTGWKGYLGNGLAGAISSYIAGRVFGPEAGKAALVGATVIILDRVLTEKFSAVGQYLALSGAGDATATGKMGTIAEGYFVHPIIVDANGQPVIPHQITDAALAAVANRYPQLAPPARAPGAMGAATGRYRNTYASGW